ncbi:MAG TPA: glycosyltransferase family 2 protein [Bacteroidaceae bacterium]|nr:glycosyltransferase family 2 protein [Bacteroidaceae bacterium]
MRTKIAIVILNWNGGAMLEKFLPTLIKFSNYPGTEIIVTDNNSDDNSGTIMGEKFSDIPFIRLDKNYGFAEGYNIALSSVDAEYYILLNSDVEVTENWLSPLVEYLDSNPDIAACQPKLLSYKEPDLFEYAGASGGYMDKWGYLYCRGRIMNSIEQDKGQYDDIVPVFWATGAALMIRSKDYWNVGGLDAKFFAHMEEIDLCWRLRRIGREIVCIPASKVFHVGAATLKRENPLKTYLNFRNNLLTLYKNLSANDLKRVMIIRIFLDMLAALMFLLQGKFRDFSAVIRARIHFAKMRSEYKEERERLSKIDMAGVDVKRGEFSILWQYYFKRVRKFSSL